MTANSAPRDLWEEWRLANIRAQETGTFEDCEIARKAYAAYLRSTDGTAYAPRTGTNVIDLGARRERHS